MRLIVLDLELNQPSRTVIQIGALQLDLASQRVGGTFDQLCNPGELPNPYISDLTGIQPDAIERAPPFALVVDSFWRWCRDAKVGLQMLAWGEDVELLAEQSRAAGVVPPKLRTHDLRETAKLFRAVRPGCRVSGGLLDTLGIFGLDFEGVQHRALDDAHNTGRLACRFFRMLRQTYEIEKILK